MSYKINNILSFGHKTFISSQPKPCESPVPQLEPFEVYDSMRTANKPKSGAPGDLPRKIIMLFALELATPECNIYNSILKSAKIC
jgi:hypothetical protein